MRKKMNTKKNSRSLGRLHFCVLLHLLSVNFYSFLLCFLFKKFIRKKLRTQEIRPSVSGIQDAVGGYLAEPAIGCKPPPKGD